MRLTELSPAWIVAHGRAIGVSFRCPGPCCAGKVGFNEYDPDKHIDGYAAEAGCIFRVALDGMITGRDGWEREGDTFETLTLRPSVWISRPTHWHGYLVHGEAIIA